MPKEITLKISDSTKMVHALKNAWVTLTYMPCLCAHGFVCCGYGWDERDAEQYAKNNPEVEYGY